MVFMIICYGRPDRQTAERSDRIYGRDEEEERNSSQETIFYWLYNTTDTIMDNV